MSAAILSETIHWICALVVGLLAAWFGHWLSTRHGSSKKAPCPSRFTQMQPKAIHRKTSPQRSRPERIEKKAPQKEIARIDHSAMIAHIMRVPPAQQASIESHYLGMRVRWRASLFSVHRLSNGEVVVNADLPEGAVLECRMAEGGAAALLHVERGGPFWLEGTLELVGQAYCQLADCVALPDPADPEVPQ